MSELIYLASPYSKYRQGRDLAFQDVCDIAARLMLEGYKIFCPIAHSHPIEVYGMSRIIKEGDFWLEQDFAVLQHCTKMIVAKMDGWEDSYGVQKEIEFAKEHNIPVEYLEV